ncbi:hypothetical protein MYU51_014667 [Penicillium brevicompactum]
MERHREILLKSLNHQEEDVLKQLQHVQDFQNIVGVILLLAAPISTHALSALLGIEADQLVRRLNVFRFAVDIPKDADQTVRILDPSLRDFLVQSASEFHKNDNDLLSILIRDAKRFTLKNLQIADRAPLQIYWAGLLFAPRTSVIRTEFQSELPGSKCQSPHVPETWGAELQILEGHSDWISSVSFSPDGQLVASGSDDRRIRLWETATGALRKTLEGPSSCVTSLSFSPDSQLLASGQLLSENGLDSLLIWDIASGSIRHSLQGHGSSVESVCFSPDGRVLVSGSSDGTVRLWNISTGDLQQTLDDNCDKIFCVAASPDGQFFASGSKDRQVHVWELETGDLVSLYTISAVASSLAFSPDSQLLACGGNSKDVTLWDLTTDDTKTLQGHSSWIRSVAFSPDGRLLAGASQDKTIYLWDIETGNVQETLEGHFNYVTSVAFSPDSRLLASGSNDQTLRVWEIEMDPQQKLESNSDCGGSVVFSSSNRLEVNRVNSMTFSPDGRLLASSSNDNIVRLWDTATGRLVQTFNGHSDWVLSVGFSPDGSQLASGSMDRTIKLWNVTTGVLQQSLEGHSETVRSVVFSPDGQLLVSGSNDKTVCVWDLMTGSLQQTLKFEGNTEDLLSAIHNLANFDDEDQRERPSPASSDDILPLSIDQGQWINVNGQNVLWLPPDFRPCLFAAYKSRIALGHISGRVCFFRFSL